MKSTNINKNLIILQEFKRATLLSGAEKLLNGGDFKRFSRLLTHYESKLNEKQWTSELVYERFLRVLEHNDIIFEAAPRTPAPVGAPSGASDDEVREIRVTLKPPRGSRNQTVFVFPWFACCPWLPWFAWFPWLPWFAWFP